jgi:ribonuclease J
MQIKIHRGAHEVGGSCVELKSHGSRIVLDIGKPLWAGWNEQVPLPLVAGLADGSDPSLAGLLISHPHMDHYGLIDQVDARVPLFIGKEAAALLKAAELFSSAGLELHPTDYLSDRVPLQIGAFTVTPFLVDHSGFDSYSLLIEAEGKRLFYSGDFRGHGRKANLFKRLLNKPPLPIDVLLCEGTHIRREQTSDEEPRSELDVELSLVKTMSETTGATCVVSSAQNLDRLVTVYRASKRTGRILVTDLYTATLADAIGRPTIPQPGFTDYKVYIPNRQRVLVKESGEFDRLEFIRGCRVFPEWLRTNANKLTLLMPSSTVPELLRAQVLEEGVVIWSLWPGYLKEPSGARIRRNLEATGVPFVLDHASGHAPVADLQRLAAALRPGRVVPIHTEAGDRFDEYFADVEVHRDGEWWKV